MSSSDNEDDVPRPEEEALLSTSEKMGKSRSLFPIFQKNFKPRSNPLQDIQQAIQKTLPKKRKRSLLGKKETPGMMQMVLDAGQKIVGPRLCADCGLLYSPGDIEDENEHRKAHARLENVHTVKLWKNPQVLSTFSDGCHVVVVESRNKIPRLKSFIEWIESELCLLSDCGHPNERILLYLCPAKRKQTMRILGFAAIEILEKGKIVGSLITEPEDSHLKPDVPATVGITRLWTDPLFRRKQIATRIVDAVRFNSGIPNYVVPKEKLGILEPSEEGRTFMIKYSDSKAYSYTYTIPQTIEEEEEEEEPV